MNLRTVKWLADKCILSIWYQISIIFHLFNWLQSDWRVTQEKQSVEILKPFTFAEEEYEFNTSNQMMNTSFRKKNGVLNALINIFKVRILYLHALLRYKVLQRHMSMYIEVLSNTGISTFYFQTISLFFQMYSFKYF